MIISLIRSGASFVTIITLVFLMIPVLVISLSFHEFSHAQVSYWLGDPTAYMRGRKTLNPIAHLDVIGTLSFLIFGIGWAKPVPIDSRYYKYPKFYTVLTSLAGPFSNIILSFVACPIMISLCLINATGTMQSIIYIFIDLFYLIFTINITLAVFNLLIIPPLDGSSIVLAFLPPKAYYWVLKYQRVISLVLIVLLYVGIFDVPLSYARSFLGNTVILGLWGNIIPMSEASVTRFYEALSMIG